MADSADRVVVLIVGLALIVIGASSGAWLQWLGADENAALIGGLAISIVLGSAGGLSVYWWWSDGR